MGGAWERLVRSVKTALAAIKTTEITKEEALATRARKRGQFETTDFHSAGDRTTGSSDSKPFSPAELHWCGATTKATCGY